jgi:hypothetical protein
VLTLGDGGTIRNAEKHYAGLQVIRQTQSDWLDEADIGILVRNIDASVVELRLVSGFTIGMRTLGDGRGVEDSTFHLGRILNNRIGLDIHCATATAWNTSIRYYGGHFAHRDGDQPQPGSLRHPVVEGGRAPIPTTTGTSLTRRTSSCASSISNVAIPFLNETSGSAIIGRATAHGGLLADRRPAHRRGAGLRVRGRLVQHLPGRHRLHGDCHPLRQCGDQPPSRSGVADICGFLGRCRTPARRRSASQRDRGRGGGADRWSPPPPPPPPTLAGCLLQRADDMTPTSRGLTARGEAGAGLRWWTPPRRRSSRWRIG